MNDLDKLYNQIISYIEDKYYFLNNKETRVFIVAYLTALRDNKIINNDDYLELLEETMMNI